VSKGRQEGSARTRYSCPPGARHHGMRAGHLCVPQICCFPTHAQHPPSPTHTHTPSPTPPPTPPHTHPPPPLPFFPTGAGAGGASVPATITYVLSSLLPPEVYGPLVGEEAEAPARGLLLTVLGLLELQGDAMPEGEGGGCGIVCGVWGWWCVWEGGGGALPAGVVAFGAHLGSGGRGWIILGALAGCWCCRRRPLAISSLHPTPSQSAHCTSACHAHKPLLHASRSPCCGFLVPPFDPVVAPRPPATPCCHPCHPLPPQMRCGAT
jgi:hypothetical protein